MAKGCHNRFDYSTRYKIGKLRWGIIFMKFVRNLFNTQVVIPQVTPGKLGKHANLAAFLLLMAAAASPDALAQSAACTAGEETLVNYDYSAATWPAGSLSNTATPYTGTGGNVTLTTAVTTGSLINTAPYVGTRGAATNRSLNIEVNRGTATASNTITLTFSRAITKLRFVIGDIDYSANNYRDRITVTGIDAISGAATVAGVRTVVANSTLTLTNTQATATNAASCADNSANCNVTWNFSTPVRVVTIVYDNGALTGGTNPTDQYIGLFDVDFCVPTVARVRPAKTTTGGVGTFNFTQTNLVSNPTVTTATAGTQALGAYVSASAVNTAASLTETVPSGWTHTTTTASCVDENRAVSGNAVGNLATLVGTTYSLPSTVMDPGARITCAYTNSVATTIAIAKISTGGTGTFSFSSTGIGTQPTFPNITTVTAGVAVTGAAQVVTPSSPIAITEALPSGGFNVTAINCTGLGAGGTQTVNLANRTVALSVQAVSPGSTIVCTFTNALPSSDLSITKTNGVNTLASGVTTTYTIRVTNGGPDAATGAILSDPAVTGLSKTAVACSAAVGNKCVTAPSVAQLEGGAFALPALAVGEFYEITVTATVTATGY